MLLAVGVAVTELAVWGRRQHVAASRRAGYLEGIEAAAAAEAALRRVATLVARGAAPQVVFDAVCEETGRLMGATTVNLAHFSRDHINETIAGWSVHGVHVPAGTRLPLDGQTINSLVQRTGEPGRVDSYERVPGPLAARQRVLGIRNEVGAPVVVDGHVWGALIAGRDILIRPACIPVS